jgi:DNA-damage-inducible protein J
MVCGFERPVILGSVPESHVRISGDCGPAMLASQRTGCLPADGGRMGESAMMIQTQIDQEIERVAAEILERSGLSVSEAVRLLLTRTAEEGVLPFDPEGDADHDRWFRSRVQEALDDDAPDLDDQDATALMDEKKRAIRAKISGT